MPVVLVGNPNVGKSVLFRALTGHYQEVSNFPGTTVEIRRGRTDGQEVWDTPGVFGLARFTPEEQVTVQALTEAELVVNVVDASRLGRDLFLTLQLVALGVPLVVVLNRLDAVRQRGDFLDAEVLARRLGVPVVRAVGIRGEGVPELRQWIAEPPAPPPAPRFWSELPARARRLPPVERLLWWEEDPQAVAAVGAAPPPGNREEEYARRREAADQLAAACYRARDPERGAQWDRWLLHPVWGMAVLVAVLAAAYLFVGVAVSNRLVGRLEAWGGQHWDPWVRARVLTILPADSVVARMLVGEWGILTATVTYLLALLLPLIGAFELLLACLEDTGYLPRLAVLLDRWFLRLGLNGRAVIPLLLGFGCVTMAMISTRVLETRRERAIATILLSWTIPCSAQVGVITGLLSGLGPGWAMAYVGIVAGVFVTVGTLLDRTLSGRPTPLLLDLPPLAWPRPTELWHKWRHRVANFLWEAGPLFALGSLVVEVARITGLLDAVQVGLGPVFSTLLHLPPTTAPAFLLGFIRRDFGAVGLYRSALSPAQILTGAVTLTLFVPCLASTLVLIREEGVVRGAAIWAGSVALALAMGAAVARVAVGWSPA